MGYMQLVLIAATALVFASFAVAQECGPNEVRLPCGRRCEMRCNNAPPPPGCRNCVGPPGCRCRDGLARNPHTDRCIPTRSCSDKRCSTGEIEGPCGKRCEGTCARPSRPRSCQPRDCHLSGCLCDLDGGFVRVSAGFCVRRERC